MNTSIHVIIGNSDEVIGVLGDRSANVGPMIQIYNQDMIGGPVSISFGSRDEPADAVIAADALIRELIRVRTELQELASLGFGKRPPRPELVPQGFVVADADFSLEGTYRDPLALPTVFVEDHGYPLISIAGAGDPNGESHDAPAIADDDR